MFANFSGVEFYSTVLKFRKRRRGSSSCVNASTKREIRQFHVEVVQRRQRNVQKKRDARAKLLFCQSKPIAFLPSLLPSPLPQLSIFDLFMTFRVSFLISYISNRTAPQPTPSAFNSTSLAYEHGGGQRVPHPCPQKAARRLPGL